MNQLTETAKKIRKELKENFNGIKFSVRIQRYSIGGSIDISWDGKPARIELSNIISKFRNNEKGISVFLFNDYISI